MSAGQLLSPPVVKKVPQKVSYKGKHWTDDYHWMRNKSDPEVLEYIKAENKYVEEMTRHTQKLQERLYQEFVGRMMETDRSVAVKIDDYWYYERTQKGKQYPIYCRKKGSLEANEEVLLDQNALGEGFEFYAIGEHKVSPDHKLLAYSVDTAGNEMYTLHVKDLDTGMVLEDRIEKVYGIEWANDNRTIFYSVLDEVHRPCKVFRHMLGTDPRDDAMVYHEKDPLFEYLVLGKTKTKKYVTIIVESHTTSEVFLLDAFSPRGSFRSFHPREKGMKYFVFHHEERFLVVTNDCAKNFRIVETPTRDTSKDNWRDVVPHSEVVSIDVSDPVPCVDVFARHMVLLEREDGLRRMRVIDLESGDAHHVNLPEEMCQLSLWENPYFESEVVRFSFSSFVTPERVYDYDMATRQLRLRKQVEVPGYEPSVYEHERIFATAPDGVNIPIQVVHRKGIAKNGKNPLLLYAYGAYADFEGTAPKFNPCIVSLLDRGVVYAVAHIRGGGEMGRTWHEQGRVFTKKNSFTDFIACAEHLISERYTSSDRVAIRGRSAGGLLMGAVVTMRPELFRVCDIGVPFVDVVNTMTDPTIPLTIGEYEEWGNPDDEGMLDYWMSYSPYDNIRRTEYPHMLVTAGWNDTRVGYWEPAKFVAKLRDMKTDNNLLLLKTKIIEGHLGASGRYDALREDAFAYAFILDRLGTTD